MNKEPEPLLELLFQEFPNKDPIEIEHIIQRVKEWLEQIRQKRNKDLISVITKIDQTDRLVMQAHITELDMLLRELSRNEAKKENGGADRI
jgi:hypothetical protein